MIARFIQVYFIALLYMSVSTFAGEQVESISRAYLKSNPVPVFSENPLDFEKEIYLPSAYLYFNLNHTLGAIVPNSALSKSNKLSVANAFSRYDIPSYLFAGARIQEKYRSSILYKEFTSFFVIDTNLPKEASSIHRPTLRRSIDDIMKALINYTSSRIDEGWIKIQVDVGKFGQVTKMQSASLKWSKLKILFGKDYEYLIFHPLLIDEEAQACQMTLWILNKPSTELLCSRKAAPIEYKPLPEVPKGVRFKAPVRRDAWIRFAPSGHVQQVIACSEGPEILNSSILNTLRKWTVIPERSESENAFIWTQVSLLFEPDSLIAQLEPAPDSIPFTMPKPINAPILIAPFRKNTDLTRMLAKFVINENGKIEQITFEENMNRNLKKIVRKALLDATYEPATRNNRPVAIKSSQSFVF